MWIALALLAILLASSGLVLVFWGLVQVTDALFALKVGDDSEDLPKRVRDLEYTCDLLPQKWDEMVKEARRAEGRAHSAIVRARKELAARGFADENLDEHADELRELDDIRGGNGGMQSVQRSVAPNAVPAEPREDAWILETRRKKFGF